jgi:hypothetical protein
MPTSYSDQFFTIDPFNGETVGTLITIDVYTLIDNDDDGDLGAAGGDTVNGIDITNSWPGDTVTLNVGGTNITYTGTTFYLDGASAVFTPTDGQVLQEGTFVSSTGVTTPGPLLAGDLGPPCFLAGSRIETPAGPRAAEALRAGDFVVTADRGLQPLVAVAQRELTAAHLAAHQNHLPIRIRAGALGDNTPSSDLIVSPQHRILLRSDVAESQFGCAEILVPAVQLLRYRGVERITDVTSVCYVHLLFDHHAIVSAHGAWSESLYFAACAKSQLGRAQWIDFSERFQDFKDMRPARPFVRGRALRDLLEHHQRCDLPLVENVSNSAAAAIVA